MATSGSEGVSDPICDAEFTAVLNYLLRSRVEVGKISSVRSLLKRVQGSQKHRYVACLCELMLDEQTAEEIKEACYQALFEATQAPVESWPVVLEGRGQFRFPNDIDWVLLRELLLAAEAAMAAEE